jgi:hypothetical protein
VSDARDRDARADARRRASLPLALLPGTLAVCRLDADAPVPAWALASRPISAIMRTPDELSLVVAESALPGGDDEPRPPGLKVEPGWRAFVVRGPLPFDLVGIFASVAGPLAEAGLSIFALATFDTDYVLVKAADVARAREALVAAGHEVRDG